MDHISASSTRNTTVTNRQTDRPSLRNFDRVYLICIVCFFLKKKKNKSPLCKHTNDIKSSTTTCKLQSQSQPTFGSAHKVRPTAGKHRLSKRLASRPPAAPSSTRTPTALTAFLPVILQSALEIMVNIFCMLLNDDLTLRRLRQRWSVGAGC